MTQLEKTEKQNALTSELLRLQGIMRDSDAHAMKCWKLGLDFKTEYPHDYESYTEAREAYNRVEEELAELIATPVEEVHHEGME